MSLKYNTYLFLGFFTVSMTLLNLMPACGQSPTDEKFYNSMEWRLVGPFRGGRSCAITGVEQKPQLFFMGTTGGGVWKSMDAGKSWKNISDGFYGGSIGAVEVSKADPNVIYVGEGEETIRGNVSPGRGLWKSDDGGKTWKKIGFEESRHIVRIRTHPQNPDIVLVAVLGNVFRANSERGLFKSTDGGKSWKKVLFANDSTGVIEVTFDPVNPRLAYACTWNMQRNAYKLSSGGPGSGIWRSTDGGDHWTNISGNKGLPKGTWGISTLAVCPSNNDRIYAMIENENGGLFRSDDGGTTWVLINGDRSLRQRAWYFSRIYAHPKNENEVYVLNVSLHKSTDGGNSFKTLAVNHGDNHDFWINPQDPNYMCLANDGGGQVTEDGGKHWSTQSNQATAQFYRLTTDNDFPFRIYAAQQDNSTMRIRHRSRGYSISESDWEPTAGGESGYIAVDPLNPEVVYGGSYGGYLSRYDHQRKLNRSVHVWPDNPIGHGAKGLKYRFQWNFPLFFSPNNPKRLYCASNYLHVSDNEGQSWRTISPDLTRNDSTKLWSSGGPITQDNTSVEYYCTIFSAAESPRKKDLLWVGSDDGLVHVSRDGGDSWQNVTPKGLPEWTQINSIEPDPHSEGGCYIAATAYKFGDFKPYLFKTEDYGQTWKSITKGIPNDHFTRVIRCDPQRKGLLFTGTEYGIFMSFDDGNNWKSFQLNLPIVPITDLVIKDAFLIAATQGRSIWIIDDLGPVRQLQDKNTKASYLIFNPKPEIRMDGGSVQSASQGINHPNGLMLHMYIDSIESKDTVQIYCIGPEKDTICSWSTQAGENQQSISLHSGSNRLILQPYYKPAKSFEGMVLWWSSLSGPKPIPGSYTLAISGNKINDSMPFEIIADPLYPVSSEDIKKQFEFIKKVRDRIDEAHKVILRMRDIKSQMGSFCANIEKNKKTDSLFILKALIDSVFTNIENELYQTKSKSNQDPINYPIKLTNKLAHLISLYEGGSYPPTDQAEEFRKEIDQLILIQLQNYQSIVDHPLKRFNELARLLELDFIKPKQIKD